MHILSHNALATWLRPSARTTARRAEHPVRRMVVLWGKLILPAAFIVLAVINVGVLDRMPQVCVWRTLFHTRCLGCGMTHAFVSVLHGQFTQAFDYNPLVIVAFPYFATLAIRYLWSFVHEVREVF